MSDIKNKPKVKVFEIESYTDKKTKKVTRRFLDQLAYFKQESFLKYKHAIVGASHILYEDGTWKQWCGNNFIECEEPIIVLNANELKDQEL